MVRDFLTESLSHDPIHGYIPFVSGRLPAGEVSEQQIIDHFVPSPADPVARAFFDFEALDSLLFPLEMVGGLHEKDIIETIRISPKDAQRGFSDNTLMNKVSGDAVYHFGGFFKRS